MKVFAVVVPHTEALQSVYCRLTFRAASERRRFESKESFRGLPMAGDLMREYDLARATEHPGEREAPLADRLAIGYTTDPMVLSTRALEVLMPRIGADVQLVPVRFGEGDFSAINVTRVIDALDVERSTIERFPSSGRVSRVLRHVFRASLLEDRFIFKIPQAPSRSFVTDGFVSLVHEAGLTGFAFDEVWNESASTAT